MRTQEEFIVDSIRRLNLAGVDYMLTGSVVSSRFGVPRSTHDLDVVVHFQPAEVPQLVAAFREGFFLQESLVRGIFRPPHQFNAMDEQSAFKIDFWLLKQDLLEQSMFKRRIKMTLLGVDTFVATPEDVLLHKLYWNKLGPSERQLGDAAGIFAVQQDALDVPYMRRWAEALGVTDVLERILNGEIRPKTT